MGYSGSGSQDTPLSGTAAPGQNRPSGQDAAQAPESLPVGAPSEPIIGALSGTPDFSLASELLLGQAQKLACCQIAAAYLIEESRNEVVTVLFASTVTVERKWGEAAPLTHWWWDLWRSEEVRRIAPVDGGNCPLLEDEEYREAGIKSALWIPLGRSGPSLGGIALFSRQTDAFDDRALAAAAELGDRMAGPLESAGRYLRWQHWEKFARALQRVSNLNNRSGHTRLVLESICQECGNLLGASRVTLRELGDGDESVLTRPVTWPPEAAGSATTLNAVPKGNALPAGSRPTSLSARVAVNGETQILDLAAGNSGGTHQAPNQNSSIMVVPLMGKDRVIGVLEVARQGRQSRFTPVCVEAAEALASLAATALQNARLFQETVKEQERATNVLAQLKAVLKEVNAGVLLVSDRQQVLWMNRQFGLMFGIDGVEAIVGDDTPVPMNTLRDRERACFVDADAFFAQRDQIDADREFSGYLGDLEIVHPQVRVLQEYTTPICDSEKNYIGRLWVYHDITPQKRGEEALRRSEAQQRAILKALPDAMFRMGRDGTYLDYFAPDDCALLLPPEKYLGHSVADLLPADLAQRSLQAIDRALSTRQVQTLNYQMLLDSGARDYEARIVASGPDEVLAIVRDVTEKNFLEAQFLQSQKLDSLGRLAGGIAHDFNNLLGGIMGYASLLKDKLDPASDAYDHASIIEKATQRGARLTQQLLTAARKSPFDPKPTDVTEVMREIVQIMAHALPKNVNVVTRFNAGLPAVLVDPTQMHQVLMNLCVNAADAMPQGGTLTLSNGEVFLDETFCQKHVSLRPGPYVQLAVADSGMGISKADQAKIFDPFFTTKGPGKGTGLGLAVVYAIVNNHQGLIEVDSELNRGSTFTVYLPVHGPEPN